MRVLKPGGIFGATTFPEHKANRFWLGEMQDAFAAFPFDAPYPEKMPMQMHDSGHWYDPVWVGAHLQELGLKDVEAAVQADSYYVKSADEFLDSFGMMIEYMMKWYWSEEQRAAHPLEEVKDLLHKHLVKKYNGEGWEIKWDVIYMTGRVEK